LFIKKNIDSQIPDWDRQWMEDAFRWLINEFPFCENNRPKILLPSDFEFDSESFEMVARKTLRVLTTNMNIDETIIELTFFENGRQVFNAEIGNPIVTVPESLESYNGIYCGKNKYDKYIIALNTLGFKYLNEIIATIAHELSHVLLSEIRRIKNYDEYLADLLTIYFGIGIFNSSAALNFYKGSYYSGYNKQGYLNEKEWAYALALFISIRGESNPKWLNYLKNHIKKDTIFFLQYVNKHLKVNWYK
jgi:hypothetical protein